MARTVAELPAGSRITHHISLGVIARTFPMAAVPARRDPVVDGSIRDAEGCQQGRHLPGPDAPRLGSDAPSP